MRKKQSKTELFEAEICPKCGGKTHILGIVKTEGLIKQGFKEVEPGLYEKIDSSCDLPKKTPGTVQDKTEAKEKKRSRDRWRSRNLKLAENKRAQRNLKRMHSSQIAGGHQLK